MHYLLHELFVDPQAAAHAVDNVPHLRVFSVGSSSRGGDGGGVAGLEDLSLRSYMPAGGNSGANRDYYARDSYTREGYSNYRDSSHYGRENYRDPGYRESYRDNSRERDTIRDRERGGHSSHSRDRERDRDSYYDGGGGDSLAMSSFGRTLPGPGAPMRSPSPDPTAPYRDRGDRGDRDRSDRDRDRAAHPHSMTGSSGQAASRYGPGGTSDSVKSVPMYVSNTPHLQQHQQQHQSSVSSQQLDLPRRSIHTQQQTPVLSQKETIEAEVPFPSLVGYGVPPETVKQLIDMQAYLLQQVNLLQHCSRS